MATTYVFFTSYARRDNDDGKLADFVDRVKKRVSKKTGEDLTIFFDTTELKNGIEWQDKLGSALKEVRVIVCLCSPSYLKSAFCAKEFEVFRRRVDADNSNTVAIIPIVWEAAPLPEVIRRFHQPKDPRFPLDYYHTGLYKLSILQSQIDNFLSVIEAVADDVDAADRTSKLSPYSQDVLYDQLPDVFHNPKPGRYGVQLTVLNDRKSLWKPGTVRNTVGALMDAALAPPISWEDVPPDQTTLPKQLANAEAARLVSLFVVDRSDAAKAPWQQMLTTIDQSGQRNIAVLVGWKASEIGAPADVKNALQQLLPSGIFADYFPLDDEQAFKETVKRAIATVRMPMIASDDAKKVVAPEIRDEAVGKGIPVDSISTLPSPGATS